MQLTGICSDVVWALKPEFGQPTGRMAQGRGELPCVAQGCTKQEMIPGLYQIYCCSIWAQLTNMLVVHQSSGAGERNARMPFFPSPGGVPCVTNTLTDVPFPGAGYHSACPHYSKKRKERTKVLRPCLPSHWMQKLRRDGVTNQAWCQVHGVSRVCPFLQSISGTTGSLLVTFSAGDIWYLQHMGMPSSYLPYLFLLQIPQNVLKNNWITANQIVIFSHCTSITELILKRFHAYSGFSHCSISKISFFLKGWLVALISMCFLWLLWVWSVWNSGAE